MRPPRALRGPAWAVVGLLALANLLMAMDEGGGSAGGAGSDTTATHWWEDAGCNRCEVGSYVGFLGPRGGSADFSTGDGGASSFSVGGPATRNGFSVSTAGLVTRYGDIGTEGYGVPAIQKYGTVGGTSSDATAIVSITAPATDTIYEASGYAIVTAFTSGQIAVEAAYTDCNGGARTQRLGGINSSGSIASAQAATGNLTIGAYALCVNASSTLTLQTDFTGTATADFWGLIKRIGP